MKQYTTGLSWAEGRLAGARRARAEKDRCWYSKGPRRRRHVAQRQGGTQVQGVALPGAKASAGQLAGVSSPGWDINRPQYRKCSSSAASRAAAAASSSVHLNRRARCAGGLGFSV